MTTLEILKAGRALIAEPARWLQRCFFRYDANKNLIGCCSLGALMNVGEQSGKERMTACEMLEAEVPMRLTRRSSLVDFNDTHTHAEVLDLWDRTIAKLEAA